MNLEKDFQRLDVNRDFTCDKHAETVFDCVGCEYMYKTEAGTIRCIKKDLKNWALFHIENGFEEDNA